MTVIRYPGGNFVSGYHWRDGVGPRAERPRVRELAWQSIEPNEFGTDEYLALCRNMSWTPMLAVNLGTGTPEEARHWVEYCNCPIGTLYADLRAANGHADPHGVKLWCLGNEMDGPWQLGHVPAEHYAIRAQQAAKLMKDTDRTIETVACGSSAIFMPTYAEWDRQVLEHLGDAADYLSLHRYVDNRADDTPEFLALGRSIDRQIEDIDAICRGVQARRKSKKRAWLCFDEWNVWYKNMQMNGEGKFAPHLIEEIYNLEDALVVAGFLNSFVRHADVVRIANLAQVVNVIAPLVTRGDELLVQSIYHAFRMFSTRRDGVSLRVAPRRSSCRRCHCSRSRFAADGGVWLRAPPLLTRHSASMSEHRPRANARSRASRSPRIRGCSSRSPARTATPPASTSIGCSLRIWCSDAAPPPLTLGLSSGVRSVVFIAAALSTDRSRACQRQREAPNGSRIPERISGLRSWHERGHSGGDAGRRSGRRGHLQLVHREHRGHLRARSGAGERDRAAHGGGVGRTRLAGARAR
ncbi:MAG: hypothetical protein NTZ61_09830 [Proteobacteria bacterium]|nr:hypothetical protein [Pseudomonadota bacterium]